MSKHIGTMIVWILVAGLLLYIAQHGSELSRGFVYLTKGGSIKGLFQSINTIFK